MEFSFLFLQPVVSPRLMNPVHWNVYSWLGRKMVEFMIFTSGMPPPWIWTLLIRSVLQDNNRYATITSKLWMYSSVYVNIYWMFWSVYVNIYCVYWSVYLNIYCMYWSVYVNIYCIYWSVYVNIYCVYWLVYLNIYCNLFYWDIKS